MDDPRTLPHSNRQRRGPCSIRRRHCHRAPILRPVPQTLIPTELCVAGIEMSPWGRKLPELATHRTLPTLLCDTTKEERLRRAIRLSLRVIPPRWCPDDPPRASENHPDHRQRAMSATNAGIARGGGLPCFPLSLSLCVCVCRVSAVVLRRQWWNPRFYRHALPRNSVSL
jgi:hypothetical protein